VVTGLGARAGKIACWSARWSTAARAAAQRLDAGGELVVQAHE